MQLFRTTRPLTPSWSLVKPGLRLIRDNLWPIFYLSFLPSLVTLVGVTLTGENQQKQTISELDSRAQLGLLIAAIGSVWALLAAPGVVYLQTRAIRGEQVTAGEAFKKGISRLLPYVGVTLLSGILIVFGLLLFIIPGLIMLRGLLLARYYVVDKNMKTIAALKQSYKDSKPHAGYIWGVIGVTVAIGFVASIFGQLPVVGLLLTLAIGYLYFFAPVLRYGEVVHNLKVDTGDAAEDGRD